MKRTLQYDHYFDYQEMTEYLQKFQSMYPDIMVLKEEAKTKEGRSIWSVTITADPEHAAEKPAFYMDANTHAGEISGSMACMYWIDTLLSNHEEPEIRELLNRQTFYVIPRISPDGTDAYLHSPASVRSVNRIYPQDQRENHGLFAEDLDGDDRILMMRVKSEWGAWKKKAGSDFLMERRRPSDTDGEFYNIYTEGKADRYDGAHMTIARPLFSMDFNRNFPVSWMPDAKQPGAGLMPLSEPETQMMASFILSHNNICAVLTMHTSGGALLHPPGTHSENNADEADMKMYKEIGALADDVLKYPTCNLFDSYCVDPAHFDAGAFDDWCYLNCGLPAFTMEIWNVHEKAGCDPQWPVNRNKTDADEAAENEKIIAWLQENAPETVIPWHAFSHPQLGEVEIGGIAYKFAAQNPPTRFLEAELEKILDFSLKYAKVLPRMILKDITVKQEDEQVYRLETVIMNCGYLPTWLTNEARSLKLDRKIRIQLEGAEVISGPEETEGLGGFHNVETEYGYGGNIMTYNHEPAARRLTFIVRAAKGTSVKITASHDRGGICTKEVVID